MSMTRVPLSQIVFDAGTQIRAAINEATVAEYAEAMTEGATFPPVVLFHDGNQHYLADGFHRFMAARRNNWREIDAEIRPGTKQDALWFALGANKANGQRLTEADKKHAIVLALKAWPDRGPQIIAEQVGCSSQYVRDIRHRVATSLNLPTKALGKDGKAHSVAKPAMQHEKRAEIAALLRSGTPSRDIVATLGVRDELVGAIRRELGLGIDKSRDAIAGRRRAIRELAAQGYTSRQIAAKVGLDERTIPSIAKAEGIHIAADQVVGKIKRHDSNRIVAQIVADAENLTEGVDLIDFRSLDRAQLADWLRSLQESRDKFGGFIRRLMKEQQHGEAA